MIDRNRPLIPYFVVITCLLLSSFVRFDKPVLLLLLVFGLLLLMVLCVGVVFVLVFSCFKESVRRSYVDLELVLIHFISHLLVYSYYHHPTTTSTRYWYQRLVRRRRYLLSTASVIRHHRFIDRIIAL